MSKPPVPTGNPWIPSPDDPATVPVPLPVLIVKVVGPYTERDRKLWTFLLHAVWDELGVKQVHELPVARINQVFRMFSSDHNKSWIGESARRLVETKVIFECVGEDERYCGIASLLSAAAVGTKSQANGFLRFEFPTMLIPILKEPGRFARLRVHFLIGLSGKYAVTLYELLESVANKFDPVLEAPVETLRQWLKVPDGKLRRWVHFNQRVLQPALEQINGNPLEAGFTVAMHSIKSGRSIHKIRFSINKVNARLEFERQLQNAETQLPATNASTLRDPIRLSTIDYERAKEVAPRWDVYELERQWREWIAKKPKPSNPGAAFVAFCRKKAQQGSP